MRHLLFYAEQKAKRLSKIKSKEYHRCVYTHTYVCMCVCVCLPVSKRATLTVIMGTLPSTQA